MKEAIKGWRPMGTAPKDGTVILVPVRGYQRVYWCDDLKTWVLSRPLHIESIHEPEGWRPEGDV
jgi:hypothetical protein